MAPPTRSPSELRYAALLAYSPDGDSEISRRSAKAVADIKNCLPDHLLRIGQRFEDAFNAGRFRGFLGEDVLLVPAPRSAPFRVKDAVWPAMRICRELEGRRLCRGLAPLLVRHQRVTKSALHRRGRDRPSPLDHENSMRCADVLLATPSRITIVDDVVTRGSTFLGCARVLATRFPNAELRALAVVRTMSKQEIIAMLDPVEGSIRMTKGGPRRDP